MVESASAGQLPPQILRRPELASPIHSAPASPTSSRTRPYNCEPGSPLHSSRSKETHGELWRARATPTTAHLTAGVCPDAVIHLTPPRPSSPLPETVHRTPSAPSTQEPEPLLDTGDEELVDYGDAESPVHFYDAASPNAKAEDGDAADDPMPGSGSPAPTDALTELATGGAGSDGPSATTMAAASILPHPRPEPEDPTRTGGAAPAKFKSVIVQPSPEWQMAKTGRRKHTAAVSIPDTATPKPAAKGVPNAARDAFKRRFAGRCFRCLASDHHVAKCRDPVRCILCRGIGHLARSCPSRRPRTISAQLRSRLTFPPESIHSRIVFPPLPDPAHPTAAAKPDMVHVPGLAYQRPVRHRISIVARDAMHPAPASAKHQRHQVWPWRVVAEFGEPQEKDRALCKGYIEIGGSIIPIQPWLTAGGGPERTWWYHVKVTMEHVPPEVLGELEYTIFAARAEQTMEINGLVALTCIPSSPPIGMGADKVILIHMAGYEDWSPRRLDDTGSRTSSEHGSSAPTVIPFEWAVGVLDGRPAPTGPRSARSVSVPSRRRPTVGLGMVTKPRGTGGVPAAARHGGLCVGGRPSHTPRRTGNAGARAPRLPEPRKDIRASLRRFRDSDGDKTTLSQEDDPMVHEHACTRLSGAPLCFSSDDNADNRSTSPEYRLVSKLWAGASSSAQPLQPEEVVFGPAPQLLNIGPGTGDVSDVDDPAIRDATGRHTSDEETAEGPNDYAAFCAGMFKPAPAPMLQRPDSRPPPPPTSSRGRRRAPTASTRSSTRLAARPSSVPVAERAQYKLMRELFFINGKSAAPDAAVTAYVDMYGDDRPEEAVKAIRAATCMGNKELSRALAAIAAESEVAEMEVP
ncbi:unnamed protein product [Miscanthus lutarioriparius]|uniref:CCHC-type domain-containing protein n=1 Tax=Miscanthus lutarioriparius TaxID=422564 RepID=A0A811QPZ7_9POAL|nr:unnamed protein product [Miscanthus lutarioriparius]